MVRQGKARHGIVWYGKIRSGKIRHGKVRYSMVWYGKVRYIIYSIANSRKVAKT